MGNPRVAKRALGALDKVGERAAPVANADESGAVHFDEAGRTVTNDRCARLNCFLVVRLRLLQLLLGHNRLLHCGVNLADSNAL